MPFPGMLSSAASPELGKIYSQAIAAANRAGEKLRVRKKILGQKIEIWQDGKVAHIDP